MLVLLYKTRMTGFVGIPEEGGQETYHDIARSYYPDDVYPTYKIIEATDATEYAALSDANKDAYKMIVSCGTVDLADGTVVRTKLMAMFGAGTTTRANLVELVS